MVSAERNRADTFRAGIMEEMPKDASRATGVLFRSHIEITRILRQLARDQTVLSAEVGNAGQLFLTRLLNVDPDGEYFAFSSSQQRHANLALLEPPHVL